MIYLEEIVDHVNTLELPVQKEECILVHKVMMRRSFDCMVEAIQMMGEGDYLNDRYDNRIKDAILYLVLAKESL